MAGAGGLGVAGGIAERLLALELAVAELQTQVARPASEPTAVDQLAQQLGLKRSDARLAAVLVQAGYTSIDAIAAAPDEALLAVDGVGNKALATIRARLS